MQLYLLTSSIHSILGMNAFLFIECPINLKIIKHKKGVWDINPREIASK